MNKLKYPIKYALLGIEEQVGWYPGLNQLERQYDICGYIVSKVYVVGETIKYNGDGTYRLNYQVVFPFISPTERIRQIPSYDLNCNCHNYINVNRVFDYYDSAKDICIEKK